MNTLVQHVPARHGLRIDRGSAPGGAAACSALPGAHQSGAAHAAPHEAPRGMFLLQTSPRLAALALLAGVLFGVGAQAHTPRDPEDAAMLAGLDHWMISARNSAGDWCCKGDEVAVVEVRQRGEHYEVRFRRGNALGVPYEWLPVRPGAVVLSNPAGVPVAWWYGGEVRCFAPPAGG